MEYWINEHLYQFCGILLLILVVISLFGKGSASSDSELSDDDNTPDVSSSDPYAGLSGGIDGDGDG